MLQNRGKYSRFFSPNIPYFLWTVYTVYFHLICRCWSRTTLSISIKALNRDYQKCKGCHLTNWVTMRLQDWLIYWMNLYSKLEFVIFFVNFIVNIEYVQYIRWYLNFIILKLLIFLQVNPSHAAIKISINATAAEFICKNIFPTPVQIKKIIKNKIGDIQQIYLYQNVCK